MKSNVQKTAIAWMVVLPVLWIGGALSASACTTDACSTDQECVAQHGTGWVCIVDAGACLNRSSRDGGDADGGKAHSDAGETADGGAEDGGATCPAPCETGTRCEGTACVCDSVSCPDGCCTGGVCFPRNECGSCGQCQWLPAGLLPNPAGASILLSDGRVLVVGGGVSGPSVIGGGASNDVSVFDPSRNAWEQWPKMLARRERHAAVELRQGRVLVCGGIVPSDGGAGTTLGSCETLTLSTRLWAEAGSMVMPRHSFALVSYDEGRKAIAVGGRRYGPQGEDFLPDVEMFDVITGSWATRAAMNVGRGPASVAPLDASRFLVWGGTPSDTRQTEIYEANTDAWLQGPQMVDPRGGNVTFAQLSNGHVIVAGRLAAGDVLSPAAEEFRVGNGDWQSVSPLSVPRVSPKLVALSNEHGALAIGGTKFRNLGGGFFVSEPMADVELYRPGSNQWVPMPPLSRARSGFSAHVLRDGRVLVFGGWSSSPGPANTSAEVFE